MRTTKSMGYSIQEPPIEDDKRRRLPKMLFEFKHRSTNYEAIVKFVALENVLSAHAFTASNFSVMKSQKAEFVAF